MEELVLIDTGIGFDFEKELAKIGLNPKNVKHCLITHGHYDHVEGCKELIKLNPIMRFYAHIKDSKMIQSYINKDQDLNFKITDLFTDKTSSLKFGPYSIKAYHIPGHSSGGMAFLMSINKDKVLFSGDICGGGIESIGGNHDEFEKSLLELSKLDVDILCDGHMNVIRPSEEVSKYIEGCIKLNDYFHIGFDVAPKDLINWYNLALVSYQMKIYDTAYDACNFLLKLDAKNAKAKSLLNKIQKHDPNEYKPLIEKYLKEIYGKDF